MKKISKKDFYIGAFMDGAMKDHKLPYGLAYLNLRDESEKEAKKSWKKFKKQLKNVRK